jgi:hypothetical protein
MIESAEFFAGGAPARYEPALSGVLEVNYALADTKRVRALADVSMQTAKARVDAPLFVDGLSVVASFRRSYFELYFSILKAFNVFGENVVAPDITEGLVRLAYRRGIHQTVATFIHASDGFNFVVKPGEEVLVNFAGGLKLLNSAQIASLQHLIHLSGDSQVRFQVAYTRDTNLFSVDSQQRFGNDAFRQEVMARADGVLAHSQTNRTSMGMQYSWRSLNLTGQVTDVRAVAPWARQPIVDAGRGTLDVSPSLLQNLFAVYAEHTLRPTQALSFEGGGRAQYDATGLRWSGSARLAGSYTLPSLTTLKLSGGLVWQPTQSVLALDPQVGNPQLQPERALQLIGGIEQPLPFEALLRLEAGGNGCLASSPTPTHKMHSTSGSMLECLRIQMMGLELRGVSMECSSVALAGFPTTSVGFHEGHSHQPTRAGRTDIPSSIRTTDHRVRRRFVEPQRELGFDGAHESSIRQTVHADCWLSGRHGQSALASRVWRHEQRNIPAVF